MKRGEMGTSGGREIEHSDDEKEREEAVIMGRDCKERIESDQEKRESEIIYIMMRNECLFL